MAPDTKPRYVCDLLSSATLPTGERRVLLDDGNVVHVRTAADEARFVTPSKFTAPKTK